MKKTGIALLVLCIFSGLDTYAQSDGLNYPASDNLGRSLPTYEEVGDLRANKTVSMFYFTWHVGFSPNDKACDLSKIIAGHPEMVHDFDHSGWESYVDQKMFFWTEPLFGFSDGKDKWVIRKQLEMLGAAGVDVLFFDATNGSWTWKEGYEAVGEVMAEMRADGVENVPQFAFLLNLGPLKSTVEQLVQLYDDLYSLGKYRDSWFMWKGKPCIMAYPETLDKFCSSDSDTAGLKFTASSPFRGISAKCPSWENSIGDLTLSLYAWNKTYAASVAQPALACQTFVGFDDPSDLHLEFDPFPVGNYVWELSSPQETVGVFKYRDETPEIDSYFNGAVVSGDYASGIEYVSKDSFSPLSNGAAWDAVQLVAGVDPAKLEAIKNFFTFRPGYGGYEGGPTQDDQWAWLENAPQNKYMERADGSCEFMTAGIAQNWSEQTHAISPMNGPKIRGRSYTTADGFDKLDDDSYLHGYNFQEQWNRVLEVDPDVVFITGWNEWVVGRHESWQGVENAFPDLFTCEYSRDIEPMKGGYGDNYYYQLVSNIRKFKGLKKPEMASPEKTISIDGKFSDWSAVKPGFTASRGNTHHRDGYGYRDPKNPEQHLHYVNTTGRNDIIGTKVARDESVVYFLVESAETLTPSTDDRWMQLLIDVDRNKATGWEGYDYIVAQYGDDGNAELGRSSKKWKWIEAGRVSYKAAGSGMEIAIPRALLGLSAEAPLDIEFKWIDNVDPSLDIMQFYLDGDVAPGGRFNYRYLEEGGSVNIHENDK